MMAGKLSDSRTIEALDIVERKRRSDGKWQAEDYYWSPRRKSDPPTSKVMPSNVDIVDWGRKGPNEFVSLNALRVLKATTRL